MGSQAAELLTFTRLIRSQPNANLPQPVTISALASLYQLGPQLIQSLITSLPISSDRLMPSSLFRSLPPQPSQPSQLPPSIMTTVLSATNTTISSHVIYRFTHPSLEHVKPHKAASTQCILHLFSSSLSSFFVIFLITFFVLQTVCDGFFHFVARVFEQRSNNSKSVFSLSFGPFEVLTTAHSCAQLSLPRLMFSQTLLVLLPPLANVYAIPIDDWSSGEQSEVSFDCIHFVYLLIER